MTKLKPWQWAGLAFIAILLLSRANLPLLSPEVTAAYYVFEKDDGEVPSAVMAALSRLNLEKGILANEFEEDSVDGDGQVPDQYKEALEAARKEGLPSLVVLAGDDVVRVVMNPTTEEAVMEAVE